MKVSELIEKLEIAKETYGNVEVGIAEQPSYPLLYGVDGVVYDDDKNRILIVEGYQKGYGKKEWFDEYNFIEG